MTPKPFSKISVADLFDEQALYYATDREVTPWFVSQLNIVMSMLETESGLVLDVGCAAGAEIAALRAREFSVVGVDRSERMLEVARSRFARDLHTVVCCADAESLPFPSGSFDQLLCLGVLEYLPSHHSCVAEMHRVLRPGGLVIFSIPSMISLHRISYRFCQATAIPLWRMVKRITGKRISTEPLSHNWNRCIPWRFRHLLRQHGFKPQTNAYSGFFLFPLEHVWPAAHIKLFSAMERHSNFPLIRWMFSQYLVSARKQER